MTAECFTSNNVEQRKRAPKHLPGRCACGKEDRRPGQGDGPECHRKAQAAYRNRQKIKLQKLEADSKLLHKLKLRAMRERITAKDQTRAA